MGTTPAAEPHRDALLADWQSRWRQAAGTDGPWSPDAAAELLDRILDAVTGAGSGHGVQPGGLSDLEVGSEELQAAARRWARAQGPAPTLVHQLGLLREVLVDHGLVDPTQPAAVQRLQRLLDRVTLVATEAAVADLYQAAHTDALTGVGNRRALEQAARSVLAAAVRAGHHVTVVSIDLVGLKRINDTEGHLAGDRALTALTAALGGAMRSTDQLFRVGGDEFVVLMPLARGSEAAELMRRAGAGAPAFTWGAASLPEDGTALTSLLAAADSRLYGHRRRQRGRLGGPSPTSTPGPWPPAGGDLPGAEPQPGPAEADVSDTGGSPTAGAEARAASEEGVGWGNSSPPSPPGPPSPTSPPGPPSPTRPAPAVEDAPQPAGPAPAAEPGGAARRLWRWIRLVIPVVLVVAGLSLAVAALVLHGGF